MAWILVGKESALAEVRKICSPIIYIFRQVGTSGRFRFECDAGLQGDSEPGHCVWSLVGS
jgi:hypothetical protein